jgi:hypothetical protein
MERAAELCSRACHSSPPSSPGASALKGREKAAYEREKKLKLGYSVRVAEATLYARFLWW